MLCFQSVLYCIVLYNDVFTFLYVAVGNKLLLLLLYLVSLEMATTPLFLLNFAVNTLRKNIKIST